MNDDKCKMREKRGVVRSTKKKTKCYDIPEDMIHYIDSYIL